MMKNKNQTKRLITSKEIKNPTVERSREFAFLASEDNISKMQARADNLTIIQLNFVETRAGAGFLNN